jgi:membrane-bound metal-dependent hydrolase YbcI (DUF457 family)
MPNGRTHRVVGTAAGALVAGARTRQEDGSTNLLMIFGGAVGGYISSTWPDLLEPATSPRHRQFAHSSTAGCAALRLAAEAVPKWEAYWRQVALGAGSRRSDPRRPPLEQTILALVEAVALAMVGLLAGLAAGYISHLVLDGSTPMSLPLVGLSNVFAQAV